MTDLWEDEEASAAAPHRAATADDDWDEGEESLESTLEDAFDDPDGEVEDEDWEEGDEE